MSLKDHLQKQKNLKGFKTEGDPDIVGIDTNIIEQEYRDGVQLADSCRIPQMEEHFCWKRGFQNCWTGFPNDGKTTAAMFLMTVKSMYDGWKWVVWSPEMKSANFVDGKVKTHYNDLAYEIIGVKTGKTPYKHIHEKYKVPICTIQEIRDELDWIREHFVFIDPKEKKIDDIYGTLSRVYDARGFDGVLIDPFKNIEAEHNVRDDKHLHGVFAKFKDFSVETNSIMNWVAHPKANVQRTRTVNGEEVLVPCNQYMLSGGAAWDNSMDGIYSIQRPDFDVKSNRVIFHNLKQRKQEITCQRGSVEGITFNIKTRRYLFDGADPLGSNVAPLENMDLTPNLDFEENAPF